MNDVNDLRIRPCQEWEISSLHELFYDTVHAIGVGYYTNQQLSAWAPREWDQKSWEFRLLRQHTVVAVRGESILGFGSLAEHGVLDMLFVHSGHQGQGIGTALCDHLEQAAGNQIIQTHASMMARPFFEKRGYKLIKEQQVCRKNVWLRNYFMEKSI